MSMTHLKLMKNQMVKSIRNTRFDFNDFKMSEGNENSGEFLIIKYQKDVVGLEAKAFFKFMTNMFDQHYHYQYFPSTLSPRIDGQMAISWEEAASHFEVWLSHLEEFIESPDLWFLYNDEEERRKAVMDGRLTIDDLLDTDLNNAPLSTKEYEILSGRLTHLSAAVKELSKREKKSDASIQLLIEYTREAAKTKSRGIIRRFIDLIFIETVKSFGVEAVKSAGPYLLPYIEQMISFVKGVLPP